jgi:hypothetical protein
MQVVKKQEWTKSQAGLNRPVRIVSAGACYCMRDNGSSCCIQTAKGVAMVYDNNKNQIPQNKRESHLRAGFCSAGTDGPPVNLSITGTDS